MTVQKLLINDAVITQDGHLGRVGEFDTNGAGVMMAKVNFNSGGNRWYEINNITHAL